jgi:hypothetical protein
MTATGRRGLIARGVLAAVLGAVAIGSSGCAVGCGDEPGGEVLEVQLDRSTVGDDHMLRIDLCQDDRCEELTAPANQYVVDVALSDLDVDLDEPGEVVVEVVNGAARTIGTSSAPLDTRTVSDGPGCPTTREQEISVTAA